MNPAQSSHPADVRILQDGPIMKKQSVALHREPARIEPGALHVVRFEEIVNEEWTVTLPSGGSFVSPYGTPKGILMECHFVAPEQGQDLNYDTRDSLMRILEDGRVEISVSRWDGSRLFNQIIDPLDGSTSMTIRATQPKDHATGYTLPNGGRPLFTLLCDGAGRTRVNGPQGQSLPFETAQGGVLVATDPGEETGLGWLLPPGLIHRPETLGPRNR